MKERRKRCTWSAEVDARLGELWADPRLRASEVAAILGLRVMQVWARAGKLGFKKPKYLREYILDTASERFWKYVSPEPNSGCWLWSGSQDRKGYGQLRITGQGPGSLKYATHVSLELHDRPVPPGMFACHRCDMPSCVNPDHLFIGSAQENTDDMIRKGRMRPFDYVARGSQNGGSRLHETDIPVIRRRLAAGETLRSVGLTYGVTESAICSIRLRHTWRHVA